MTYVKVDPPPSRVCALPVNIIHALGTTCGPIFSCQQVIDDIIWLASVFLLQPGEYYIGVTDTNQYPFGIRDVQLFIIRQPYNAVTTPQSSIE